VCYLKGSSIKGFFLSLLSSENASADDFYFSPETVSSIEFTWTVVKRLEGIGTDGARSVTGEQNGLVEELSQLGGLTHLVGIQCITYRLRLTLLSTMKSVKYFDGIDHMLVSVQSLQKISKENKAVSNCDRGPGMWALLTTIPAYCSLGCLFQNNFCIHLINRECQTQAVTQSKIKTQSNIIPSIWNIVFSSMGHQCKIGSLWERCLCA
jgi:hypothetical protein